MAEITTTPNRVLFSSAGDVRRRPFPQAAVEIPQPPRFAVQRLVPGTSPGIYEWKTITFDDRAEDDPYYRTPLLYQSRYVAEHVAKAYADETVRVHEIGGAS